MNSEASCLPGDAIECKRVLFCKHCYIDYLYSQIFIYLSKSGTHYYSSCLHNALCKQDEYWHNLIDLFLCMIWFVNIQRKLFTLLK